MEREQMSEESTKHEPYALKQLQSLPLDVKIRMTRQRIESFADHYDDMVYTSFSGGKDSTVLLSLVRKELGDSIPAVFFDSMLEFPENRAFCKKMGAEIVRSKDSVKDVLNKYGWPVVSKTTSRYIDDVRNMDPEGATYKLRVNKTLENGDPNGFYLPDKWRYLVDAPFKISNKCCDVYKKRPAKKYNKASGRWPIIGVRCDESRLRRSMWQKYGCNGFDLATPRSWPMAFWTSDDIEQYIEQENLELSPMYTRHGYSRTGCMFCLFGFHMNPTRLDELKASHPRVYSYVMDNLGAKDVLPWLYGEPPSELFGDEWESPCCGGRKAKE